MSPCSHDGGGHVLQRARHGHDIGHTENDFRREEIGEEMAKRKVRVSFNF